MKLYFTSPLKKACSLLVIALLLSGMTGAQQKTTMSVKDLDSKIEKYIDKNYKDYKAVEAYEYAMMYEMKIQKEATHEVLVFDAKGKFLAKKTEADNAKTTPQTRTTMALKDVESDITKYIKKNFEGFKLTEAYEYEVVYTVKIVKAAEHETLVFDKDGKFLMKEVAKPAAPAHKADTAHAKPAAATHHTDTAHKTTAPTHHTDTATHHNKEMKEEPAKIDTTKK